MHGAALPHIESTPPSLALASSLKTHVLVPVRHRGVKRDGRVAPATCQPYDEHSGPRCAARGNTYSTITACTKTVGAYRPPTRINWKELLPVRSTVLCFVYCVVRNALVSSKPTGGHFPRYTFWQQRLPFRNKKVYRGRCQPVGFEET